MRLTDEELDKLTSRTRAAAVKTETKKREPRREPKPPPADWEKGAPPARDSRRVPPARLHTDLEGIPKKIVGNVMTILCEDIEWKEVIAYDLFREAPVLTRQPPQRDQDLVAREAGADWAPQDSTRATAWLYAEYGLNIAAGVVTEAMLTVAQKRIVHPVRAYLDGLTWDGVPRVDDFFSRYCRTPPSDYSRGVSRLLFLAAVARVRRPGCKVDTMVILEGKQGEGKSTLLSVLAGPWFADTPLPIGDKDAYQGLRGVWIYELAELVSIKGRDATRVKSFASSPSDHYRPSYEPRARAVPRQCIFVATTNEREYLVDATGARRFWPVAIGRVDIEAVRRDRDQLWAEADRRFGSGEPWWPTAALDVLGAGETEDRYEGDPWEAPLLAWLERPVSVHWDTENRRHESPIDPADGFTMAEILGYALSLTGPQQNKQAQERATQILRRAGWTRTKQRREQGKQVRRWHQPNAGDALVTGGGDRGGDP